MSGHIKQKTTCTIKNYPIGSFRKKKKRQTMSIVKSVGQNLLRQRENYTLDTMNQSAKAGFARIAIRNLTNFLDGVLIQAKMSSEINAGASVYQAVVVSACVFIWRLREYPGASFAARGRETCLQDKPCGFEQAHPVLIVIKAKYLQKSSSNSCITGAIIRQKRNGISYYDPVIHRFSNADNVMPAQMLPKRSPATYMHIVIIAQQIQPLLTENSCFSTSIAGDRGNCPSDPCAFLRYCC